MGKPKQKEVYYNDPINSCRSFMPASLLSNFPVAIRKDLRERLELFIPHSANQPIEDDDMLLLSAYTFLLQIINASGHHVILPYLLDNLWELSQSQERIDLTDPTTIATLRAGAEK